MGRAPDLGEASPQAERFACLEMSMIPELCLELSEWLMPHI